MGFQASRELGEGDMRLRVARLLLPIHKVVDLRDTRLENIFRIVSTSISEQDPEIGGSHVTDMTDSFHRQIRLEKLDTFAAGSQGVRELWAVRHHAIFVMMMYLSEIVSGAISTSAVLLVVTVMSSSGVMVSLLDVRAGQPQPLTTEVTCSDTDIVATPFVVPPSPDIEQPCIQLQDSPTCGLPESRQPWLLWNLADISVNRIVFLRSTESSAHTQPWRLPKFSSSSSSIDHFPTSPPRVVASDGRSPAAAAGG